MENNFKKLLFDDWLCFYKFLFLILNRFHIKLKLCTEKSNHRNEPTGCQRNLQGASGVCFYDNHQQEYRT